MKTADQAEGFAIPNTAEEFVNDLSRRALKCAPIWLAVVLFPALLIAQDGKAMVQEHLNTHGVSYGEVAQAIWDLAEVGYQEEQSSALLQSTLTNAGFEIEAGVAGIPTAFVASWGSGSPVIGILAEFD
jgi:aminobenzoyl-glutamate utilization protein B